LSTVTKINADKSCVTVFLAIGDAFFGLVLAMLCDFAVSSTRVLMDFWVRVWQIAGALSLGFRHLAEGCPGGGATSTANGDGRQKLKIQSLNRTSSGDRKGVSVVPPF